MTVDGPLAGHRIVDLTTNMTGPYATMVLADQGAEVIKIEPPGGDVIRRVGTGAGGMSAYFANLNRTKRSIVLDLRRAEAVEVVHRLVATADVMIQNGRPGVVERFGLGPDVMRSRHPSLVYASINGFGRVGPLAGAPAYDHVVQALSGIADRQADGRGGPPALVRHGIVDKVTGLFAAQAITAALVRRARTNTGATVEVSMLDAAVHFLWPDGMMNHTCLDPVDELPPIANGFRVTATADGYVAIITVTDAQWCGLVQAAGLDRVLADPQLATVAGRMRHGGRVMREVAARLATLPTDEVVAAMRTSDVPCMPVLTLTEVVEQEQLAATGTIEEIDHPRLGRIRQPRPVARFVGDDESPRWPSPEAGQDTREVLADMGYDNEEVDRLLDSGAAS
jgi:crotonobetainyl-CoA:carnitine CoA-transferase CaiB-like acyl-CoA transferase